MTKLFVIKQGYLFFVIYHKGFCYYNVVCQNVSLLIKEQMEIFPQQPGVVSRLAEEGDFLLYPKLFLCVRI